MPEKWRVALLFKMVPLKNLSEVKSKWELGTERNINKFASNLVRWANNLKFDQKRRQGAAPMEVDVLAEAARKVKDEHGYSLEDYTNYHQEEHPDIDWMGKGKGKGKVKGKGKGKCHWCGKDGHHKSECQEFSKWKKDKDEDRRRKGLPPYKPPARREVNNVDDGYEDLKGEDAGTGMLDFDIDCDVLAEETQQDGEPDWEYLESIQDELVFKGQSEVLGKGKPTEVHNKFHALEERGGHKCGVIGRRR